MLYIDLQSGGGAYRSQQEWLRGNCGNARSPTHTESGGGDMQRAPKKLRILSALSMAAAAGLAASPALAAPTLNLYYGEDTTYRQ
jgi:hypothetical protein